MLAARLISYHVKYHTLKLIMVDSKKTFVLLRVFNEPYFILKVLVVKPCFMEKSVWSKLDCVWLIWLNYHYYHSCVVA